MISKFIIPIITGILIGLVIIGIVFLVKNSSSKYYAVFLNNGSVYFGKLSTFPKLKLDNVLYITVDSQGELFLNKFKDLFWQPNGPIYLNKDSILFIAPMNKNSNLVKFIEEQNLLTQSQQQQQPQPQPQPQQPQLQPQQLPSLQLQQQER